MQLYFKVEYGVGVDNESVSEGSRIAVLGCE